MLQSHGGMKRACANTRCICGFLSLIFFWMQLKFQITHFSEVFLLKKHSSASLMNWKSCTTRLRKPFFFLSQAVPFSMAKTCLLFPAGSRKKQQESTGELWRGPDTTLDCLLSSRRKGNEDSSEQILRGSPGALIPLDPDDTFPNWPQWGLVIRPLAITWIFYKWSFEFPNPDLTHSDACCWRIHRCIFLRSTTRVWI